MFIISQAIKKLQSTKFRYAFGAEFILYVVTRIASDNSIVVPTKVKDNLILVPTIVSDN